MAGDGGHGHCGVDGWVAAKVQTQLGILVVSVQQRALDRVGLARPRLGVDRPPGRPCVSEHPRRDEEHARREECFVRALLRFESGADAKLQGCDGAGLAARRGKRLDGGEGILKSRTGFF